jgi:MYXO-CTERM domain-containing protein
MHLAVVGAASLLLHATLAASGAEATPDDPQTIVGGIEATPCQFPSAVAILENDANPVMCSGTLVHPSVVTLAAHCVIPERPIVAVGFGEQGEGFPGPAREIAVTECVAHPQYDNAGNPDVAYCLLDEAVTDVPIVPILAGCETDVLQPGTEVTIVGFGSTWGTVDDEGNVVAEGAGPKRWIGQTVDFTDPDLDEVHLVGDNGSDSACFGDSGGPAFVQLDDGTWRVFGAGSRLYDPGGFPPPMEPDNVCGVGATYGYLSTRLHWIESETGRDVTPCHDDYGNWEGGPDCGDFPMAPHVGAGVWGGGCNGGPEGGGEMLCEGWVPETTGGEGSTGWNPGEGSSGWNESSDSIGTTTTPPIPPPLPPGTTSTTSTTGPSPEPRPGDEESNGADTDTDTAGAGDLVPRGCACRSGTPDPTALLLLALLGLRRRSSSWPARAARRA